MIEPFKVSYQQRTLSQHLRDQFPASRHSLVMRRPICGVGLNNADYVTMPLYKGKLTRCPAYRAWHAIIRRAHDAKLHAKHPSYFGVSVCEEWLEFMSFREWWMLNQVDGWDIDKDIIKPFSKIYSPETCIFIPRKINNFVLDCHARRGDWPIGVSWSSRDKKFQAFCKNPFTGKDEGVGGFVCPHSAHEEWKERKMNHANKLRPQMDYIDSRIYPGVAALIEGS